VVEVFQMIGRVGQRIDHELAAVEDVPAGTSVVGRRDRPG
jgi:hypothetical protein